MISNNLFPSVLYTELFGENSLTQTSGVVDRRSSLYTYIINTLLLQ